MQAAFNVKWPTSLDSYTFASETSIISGESLEEEMNSMTALRLRGGLWYNLKEILCLTKIGYFREVGDNGDFRRISVQALDFDWVFQGDNIIEVLEMLQNDADHELLDKKSITALIDMVWN